MSPRILHAILACSFGSLVLNVALLYVVVTRTPRVVASVPFGTSPSASAGAATGAAASPATADGVQVEPFQREWEYVDKASGRRLGVVILDDAERLERFIRGARLQPEQEVSLRRRYTARRSREMGLARDMVKEGAWHSEAFRRLQTQFWSDEYRALPPAQSTLLPPEFMPPG